MPITLNSVSFSYAENTAAQAAAINGISLNIEDGEFVGIMGRTGCGKSTLIQLMAGLLVPDKGQVLLDGEDINSRRYDRSKLRRRVGLVFQYPEYQLFETTVARDVAFGLRSFSWSADKVEQAVCSALELVGLDYDKIKDKSPLGFSGGEKRRIAIAGVLAADPGILILDEPIAGLDPLGREAFLKMTEELNSKGKTIIMISHNADALAEYAQRIIVLDEGRLLRDGTTEKVFSDYDALSKNRIGVPQVKYVSKLLSDRGIDIPENTIQYKQLLTALEKIFGGEDL